MARNPSIKTFREPPPAPPEGTLAVDGEPPLLRDTADQTLKNPVPATPESVARGKVLFATFCAPCHGAAAKGDGPVAKKFVPPPDLTTANYARTSDGYIYATIRNGGAIMPAQGGATSAPDRWDIINFIRSLERP